jgi:hypothetical protein
VDGIRLIAEQGHGAVRIRERLVELALLGVAPGAPVERPTVIGRHGKDLVIFGDGAGKVALVVEDGGAIVQHVDIAGVGAERGVEIGQSLVELALTPIDPGAVLQRQDMGRLDAERRAEIGDGAIILLELKQRQAAVAEIVGIAGREPIASS